VQVVVVGKEDEIGQRDVDGLAQLSVVLSGLDLGVDHVGRVIEGALAVGDLGLNLHDEFSS